MIFVLPGLKSLSQHTKSIQRKNTFAECIGKFLFQSLSVSTIKVLCNIGNNPNYSNSDHFCDRIVVTFFQSARVFVSGIWMTADQIFLLQSTAQKFVFLAGGSANSSNNLFGTKRCSARFLCLFKDSVEVFNDFRSHILQISFCNYAQSIEGI